MTMQQRKSLRFCQPLSISRVALLLIGFLVLVAWTTPALAQQTGGRLTGTVTDESGGIVPGAMVSATNEATMITREALTNERGVYNFPNLLPGTYTVSAEMDGFRKSTVTRFQVETATTKRIKFRLEVGDINQEVTVVSRAVQQIQHETSDLGDVVFERKIKDLPLNGRRPIELVLLQPGMAGNPGQGNAGGFAASGGRRAYNAIYMDGIDLTSSELGTGSTVGGEPNIQIFTEVSPSVDAVAEFRVITANPSAEFSRNSGFQVAMTTKSGTNNFHGSVYNFHRNTVLNANTFFNNATGLEREPLLRNQFGATLGGPVRFPGLYNGKNKTFFFVNYEGGRTGQFASVTRTVYTAEARQGIFRAITRNVTVNPETGSTLSRNSGAILDPVTGAILPGTVGVQTFDLIQADIDNFDGLGFDSTGTIQAILALTPLPNDFSSLFNGGSSNSEGRDGLNLAAFRFNAPGNEDGNLQTYKVDHLLGDKHTMSVRVNWGNVDRDKGDFVNNVFQPFPGIPNRARLEKQRAGSLNWITSLSPTLTNEFRIGISRNERTFTSTENVPGAISINAPGQDPFRRDNGLNFPRQTFQLTDNLTWNKGNHSMKMGFTVQTTILNRFSGANAIDIDASPFNAGVSVSLTTLCGSCNSNIPSNDRNRARRLFNFLTGRIGAISASFNAIDENQFGPLGTAFVRGYRGRDWGGFFQDDWKITPNLTLNLGLRYDYYQVPWEVNSLFVLGANRRVIDTQIDPSLPDTPIQFGRVGPAFGNQLFDDDYNNFSPVIGFSWDPFGDNKTAIRGSYRISYDHIFTRTLSNIDGSQPGVQTVGTERGQDLIGVNGILNAFGNPMSPRLSNLVTTPLHDGLGGSTGSASGTVDLGALVDVRSTQVPLSLLPNSRQGLSPDDFEQGIVQPYSQSWSLGIQREIMDNTVFEARYVGRKGTKLYTGLPANQFRLPNGWLGAFQQVQSLLRMTRGEAFGLAGVPLGGLDPNSSVTLADLYGNAPGNATDISQYVAGPLAGLAPSALASLFLATTSVFDGDLEDFFDNTSLTGLIGEIDLASGSQVHSQAFLASAGLNPFSANTGNLTAILGLAANAFRPSPQFLNGPDLFSNAASSSYHALQLQVNRRFSKGLQFQANYTFSKNIDLPFSSFSTGNSFNNFFEIGVERSLSGNDLTHDFKANAIWEVPFGRGRRWGSGISGWANQLLGGWQLSSIVSVASDFPFNVSFGSMSSSFQAGSRPSFQEGVVVDNDLVHTGQVSRDDQGNVVYWSQQDFEGVFTRPLLGNQGNTPRNWLRGPGYWNADIAVMKHFPIHNEMQVQFRAEAFNLFNNVNFSNPNSNLESSNFGRISGQNGDPRILQFALKFIF